MIVAYLDDIYTVRAIRSSDGISQFELVLENDEMRTDWVPDSDVAEVKG